MEVLYYYDKAIPVQDQTGPEGSSRLEIPEFLCSRHMKVVPYTPAAFTLKEIFMVLISLRG
jgi:hypothetical protein